MPIYEYHCQTCGKAFEIQAKIADPHPVRGQDCVSNKCILEKQLSRVSVNLKNLNQSDSTKWDSSDSTDSSAPATGHCSGGCSH